MMMSAEFTSIGVFLVRWTQLAAQSQTAQRVAQ